MGATKTISTFEMKYVDPERNNARYTVSVEIAEPAGADDPTTDIIYVMRDYEFWVYAKILTYLLEVLGHRAVSHSGEGQTMRGVIETDFASGEELAQFLRGKNLLRIKKTH